MSVSKLDVAVLGGGLAGGLLARQLRRSLPELSVGVFEKSSDFGFKVGESTVEIAGDYLVRRLGLSSYLYEAHLPKNGLRFFFDDPGRNLPLEDMSEIGPVAFPFRPAFQLDRARLERDLLEMNARDGVHVARGVKVRRLRLGTGDEPHTFDVEDGSGSRSVSARWLVDASGRASLIAKQQGLRQPEAGHTIAAAWGRFEGVADLDVQGTSEFRARVNYTSRRLSTVHFGYPGYWIWFIPLRGGVTSVGVVCERSIWQREIGHVAGMRAFLDTHRAVRELLHGAKPLDELGYTQLAFGTQRLFSPDRWAQVGEAGVFSDPFYSPGSDFIAIENDMVTDLIRREVKGERRDRLHERLSLYDEFVRFRHESTLRIHRGLYSTLGSFEIFRLRYALDLGAYYNLWVSAYMRDHHLNFFWVRKQLRQKDAILRTQANFADLFHKLEAELRARGQYHRGNRGEFATGLEHVDFARELSRPRSNAEIHERSHRLFNDARGMALDLLGVEPGSPRRRPLEVAEFGGEQPLL